LTSGGGGANSCFGRGAVVIIIVKITQTAQLRTEFFPKLFVPFVIAEFRCAWLGADVGRIPLCALNFRGGGG
jgi:hypothetical protein